MRLNGQRTGRWSNANHNLAVSVDKDRFESIRWYECPLSIVPFSTNVVFVTRTVLVTNPANAASGLGENLKQDLFLCRHVNIHSDYAKTVAGNNIKHDSRCLLSTENGRRDFLLERYIEVSKPAMCTVWKARQQTYARPDPNLRYRLYDLELKPYFKTSIMVVVVVVAYTRVDLNFKSEE